jgi:cytosine/adenosine deaminase-related metal-dependent hydrolase
MNPATMQQWGWAEVGHARSGQREDQEGFGRAVKFFLHDFLPSLRKAGVTIVAGTDAPIPVIVPGFSLLGELQSYVEAGFSPYQAIRTATIDAARVLPARRGDLRGFGTITVGAPADLILVAANPLADIENLRRPLGVVAGGVWASRAELAAGLDSLARVYRSQ